LGRAGFNARTESAGRKLDRVMVGGAEGVIVGSAAWTGTVCNTSPTTAAAVAANSSFTQGKQGFKRSSPV
jgi:hypothetical protein